MIIINYKVNSTSICALVPALVKAFFFGYGISVIFLTSKTSSLISIILGFILSLLFTLIFLKVYSFHEDKTLIEKIQFIFPKIISIPLIILILFTIFLMDILVYYLIDYFIVSHYLTHTPFYMVGFILISALYYLVTKNYEVLTRVSFILLIISIVMLSFNIIGLIPSIKIDNVLPIYNFDNIGIIKSALIFFSLFSTPLFLITFIKKSSIKDKEKLNKKLIIYLCVSGVVTFIVFFLILSNLGMDLIKVFSYPEYIALKKINFGFIKSIENICFLVWSILAFVFCSTSTLYLKDSIDYLFKIKNKFITKLIPFILCISIVIIPELLFKSNVYLSEKVYSICPIIISVVLQGTIILLFITSLFKNQKTFKK